MNEVLDEEKCSFTPINHLSISKTSDNSVPYIETISGLNSPRAPEDNIMDI